MTKETLNNWELLNSRKQNKIKHFGQREIKTEKLHGN